MSPAAARVGAPAASSPPPILPILDAGPSTGAALRTSETRAARTDAPGQRVRGVSTDEGLAALVRHRQACAAATRIVAAVDGTTQALLDTARRPPVRPRRSGAPVLILGRRPGESILIDGGIRLVVISCDRRGVRLGIEAPSSVHIVRGEIVTQIADENRRANVVAESEWLAALPARGPKPTDPAG